jgi:hypothetical protein
MSQFSQPSPSNRARRSLGFDFGQANRVQRDIVPITPTGPDYSAPRQLGALSDALTGALGTAGRLAAGINQDRAQEAAEADRLSRIAKHDAEKAKDDEERRIRNEAALASANLEPQILDLLDRGTLKPLPDETLEQFKNKVIAEYGGNESPVYHAEMNRLLGPSIIGHMVGLARKGRAVAEQSDDDAVVSRTSMQTNWLDSVAALEEARKSPGMTAPRMTSIAMRSMLIAAENGNREAVTAMQDWLGTKAPEVQQKAKADLAQVDAALARAEGQRQADAINSFQNAMSRLDILHAPITQKRAMLDAWDGQVPDEVRRSFSKSIDEEELKIIAEAEKQIKQVVRDQATLDIYTTAAAAMQSGQYATLIDDDFKRTLPDGTEVTEQRNVVRDRLIEKQMQAIDDTLAGQPETVRNKAQIAFVAPNDVLPERFAGTMTAGLGAAQPWLAADQPGQQVPAATIKALALARDLKTTAPSLYGKLDDRVRSFYDLALAAQQLPEVGAGTPEADQTALAMTMQAIRNGTTGRTIDAQSVRFSNYKHDGAKNAGAIESIMAQRASTYTRLPGMSNEKAIAAAKTYVNGFVKSNGYAMDLSAATIPANIKNDYDLVTQAVLDKWWKPDSDGGNAVFAEKQGYDRDTMFLAPAGDGLFVLMRDSGGLPLPVARNAYFTLADLDKAWQAKSAKSPANIKKEAIRQQDQIRENNKTPWYVPPTDNIGLGGY